MGENIPACEMTFRLLQWKVMVKIGDAQPSLTNLQSHFDAINSLDKGALQCVRHLF